jgi:hypothetical protein
MIKAGTVQVMIDHAYIACAIEAYKLRNGDYPKDLKNLSKKLPNDVFSGESYLYENEEKGLYLIASKGWAQNTESKEIIGLQRSANKIKTKNSNLIWHYSTSP